MTPLFLKVDRAFAQNDQGTVLKKVVIDPGHGGRDPGAKGAKTNEKDIVLDVALRVGKMINEKYPEVEVIYTRKTDVFIELNKRGEIANKAHANLFISIHANSVKPGNKCPSGTETFVMGYSNLAANMEVAKRENSVILIEDDYSTRYENFDPNRAESYIIFQLMQNSHLNQSLDFAAEIQTQLKESKRVDRGIKQAPFLVLWQTAMPSILVELGFICHPEEEKFMSSAAGKDKLAASIFQAFSSYKSKFEDRSSFRPGEQATNQQQPKTGVTPVKTSPAEPQKSETSKTGTPKVEFCVQILLSSKPLDTNSNTFKKHKGVERLKLSNSQYKYILGRTSSYAGAQETLKKVKSDFKDAFIVSIVDGKIAPVAEGLKIINP